MPKAPAKPTSKTKEKARTARKQITKSGGKTRKASAAHGVEPILEGPYANQGAEYDKLVAKGNLPGVPRLTPGGSVSV